MDSSLFFQTNGSTKTLRRYAEVPYDPKRDPQEGFIGHPKHYGFGSTKRFWEPASGGAV
jgi:hypothetical protein